MQKENALLTFKQAMAYLQVSRSMIYRLMDADRLIGHKVGNLWRFYQADLDACIDTPPKREKLTRPVAPQQALPAPTQGGNWSERRLARYVKKLVEAEQLASEEERQRLREEWYARGEDSIIEAMRYLRRKIREGRYE
jgi:excisionase family DNA binding protein